jgi:hypothetical protein
MTTKRVENTHGETTMTTLLQNTAPVLLGEVITWQFPVHFSATHADLAAALTAAGLDPKAARDLHLRHAFVRACRALASQNAFQDFSETDDELTWNYDYEATVTLGGVTLDRVTGSATLDKTTGFISCQDKTVEARLRAEMARHVQARKVQDVTRLLHGLFERHADIFPIKTTSGVYFVPVQHQAFLDKIGLFVAALKGVLTRFPVPDGTAQGSVSVERVVTDGLYDAISEYEDALKDCRDKPKEDVTLKRAAEAVAAATAKCLRYKDFVGAHLTMLEDHAAHVARMIQDRRDELAKAAAAPAA